MIDRECPECGRIMNHVPYCDDCDDEPTRERDNWEERHTAPTCRECGCILTIDEPANEHNAPTCRECGQPLTLEGVL